MINYMYFVTKQIHVYMCMHMQEYYMYSFIIGGISRIEYCPTCSVEHYKLWREVTCICARQLGILNFRSPKLQEMCSKIPNGDPRSVMTAAATMRRCPVHLSDEIELRLLLQLVSNSSHGSAQRLGASKSLSWFLQHGLLRTLYPTIGFSPTDCGWLRAPDGRIAMS